MIDVTRLLKVISLITKAIYVVISILHPSGNEKIVSTNTWSIRSVTKNSGNTLDALSGAYWETNKQNKGRKGNGTVQQTRESAWEQQRNTLDTR